MGGCGGCGGGSIGELAYPITSGDLANPPPTVDEAEATHKVLTPGPDGATWAYYGSYRDARIAWMQAGEGAKLRKT